MPSALLSADGSGPASTPTDRRRDDDRGEHVSLGDRAGQRPRQLHRTAGPVYSQTAPATSRKGLRLGDLCPVAGHLIGSHCRRLGRLGTSARAPSAGRADGIWMWAYWRISIRSRGVKPCTSAPRRVLQHLQPHPTAGPDRNGELGELRWHLRPAYDPRIIRFRVSP